jgi:16S rRNA (uracil1498-N3)-methyltransferase
MRRRFFVKQVRNGRAELAGEDALHLTRVLRVEPGQRYEISDNASVYLAEVESARQRQVVFRTLEKLAPQPAEPAVILCAALVKFERFEWMIEKATELGVAEIVPVACVRSEPGLAGGAAKRLERWRRIAREASQQSRRDHLPVVHPPEPFPAALARGAERRRFALDEEPGGAWLSAAPGVALLVGPEGGWTAGERTAFRDAGWTRVSMGPLILRAETAAVAALAVVRHGWLVH